MIRSRCQAHLGVLGALVVVVAASACVRGGDPRAAATPSRAVPDARASGADVSRPSQFVVADPSPRSSVVAIPLGGPASGGVGLVVDKTRVVVGRGEPHVGVDAPDAPIAGVRPLPARLGGGYLFWTDTALYRSTTFDGALAPIVRLTDSIVAVSFAPKFLLARTRNGERWALGIPSGERVTLDPLGAVDVESLEDGRALAFNDQGASFSSLDGGAHWTDVTAQVHDAPTRVSAIDDDVWLYLAGGGAMRLEPNGQLSSFDKPPPEKTTDVRAPDPRWHGVESPLRTALRRGATIDESTAMVVEHGDLVRVDVHTGEIAGLLAGKLPPDARCEAVPAANDVLFACVAHANAQGAGGTSSFVVSHTLSGDSPVVEQTFQTTSPFYASDDGGLAITSTCSGAPPAGPVDHTVCVRQPGGSWQDYDLSALSGDGGTGDVNVSRWVPRADGHVVAVLLDPMGIFDPSTGQLTSFDASAREAIAQATPSYGKYRRHGVPINDGSTIVDGSWSFTTSGSLRGWQRHGGMVEVFGDGKAVRSPYAFELVSAGAYGLGRTPDGRFYQSVDHGGAWTEVAAPPSGAAAGELRACSTAGCDLGAFYRIGWAVRPPQVTGVTAPAKLASEVRRTRAAELSCRPKGPAAWKVLSRTTGSPADLGLGLNRLPVDGESSEISFLRTAIPRSIVHPLHDPVADDADSPALRAVLSGFGTTIDGDVIEVTGPNRSPSALRRAFTFVAPFDPAAAVRKATIAMSDVLATGRAAGLANDEILADDMTESGDLSVMTPSGPDLAGDSAFHNPRGLLVRVRPDGRAKVAMRPSQTNDATVISGIGLSNDEAAYLEVDPGGIGHVFKVSGTVVTDLFDVNPTAPDGSLYPANPDALAVGPHGELAIIRTGSGSDPASAQDPALLIVTATPPVALAPWSTLRLADDPACKADVGWRTTISTIRPWFRVTTPELRAEDAPMIARVKWSDKHVCLEGLELKVPDVKLNVPGASGMEAVKAGSWIVARGDTFTRIAIGEGTSWRQALECTLIQP